MALRLGRHLHEVMGWPGPMTWRQFLAWREFLREDDNRPSRADHYAMQIACEVSKAPNRVWGKEPDFNAEDFRIKFVEKAAVAKPQDGKLSTAEYTQEMAFIGAGPFGTPPPEVLDWLKRQRENNGK